MIPNKLCNQYLFAVAVASCWLLVEHCVGGDFLKEDGYRGIWFTLGQFSEHGDKYSGGLGTYTANHCPMAVYAPQVEKTFFVYGGTLKGKRHLLAMASWYDHKHHLVPRPTVVHDKLGVNDPHDNPSLALDAAGRIWVFVSGRARARPGYIYRSKAPYSVDDFELISEQEFTYPQPRSDGKEGLFLLFTKYTKGRELYWSGSQTGREWTPASKLAALGGHYQVSELAGNTIGTFFNRHPGGNVDKRTDLYYMQTTNWGAAWSTVDGQTLTTPLREARNPARVIDYSSEGKLVYTMDLNFDPQGRPALLYIVSKGHEPGVQSGPREWVLTCWTNSGWHSSVVCTSDHNYDCGSLVWGGRDWTVVGPTEPGPQPGGTGGEVAVWERNAPEQGTWARTRALTRNSTLNHSYVRRPFKAKPPFSVFWADGDPNKQSVSRLYFADLETGRVWRLPSDMEGETARPAQVP